MSSIGKNTAQIKQKALDLGFDFVGMAKAEKLTAEEETLKNWLNFGYQGQMQYLENHFEKRLDPTQLMPGARSVISLMYNYFPKEELPETGVKIARYAYGKDYHKVIKKKVLELAIFANELYPDLQYRTFVDSAPVMERQWARESGLGWIGKNTLLINKEKGSYFFLAELVLDRELSYDKAIPDYCGSCTKCLDACPTSAFEKPYVLNASKCISYATIELKDEIPESFVGKMNDWAFGCDICQEVCPWNRFSQAHGEEKFEPKQALSSMNAADWENLREDQFNEVFEGSAVKRTKYEGLKRNIEFIKRR